MTLTRWNKPESAEWQGEARWSSLRDELDQLFGAPFFSLPRPSSLLDGWAPALDLVEDKDAFTVWIELPGTNKDEIDVTLHDGVLTLSGERRDTAPAESQTHRRERFVGRFQRSVALPRSVDAGKIQAKYKDGILQVYLPKAEEAKPKHIDINVK